MTSPKHAYQNPGKGRYYRHPISGEEWPSVTNVLDTAVAKPALQGWAAKLTTAKAWQLLPRMVAVSRKRDCQAKRADMRCGNCRECLSMEMKAEHRIVRDMARDLGDRIHKRVEAHVLDKPAPEDAEVEPFALQAIRFFNDYGVDFERDVEAAEATVLNRAAGYGGTGDLWVWLRIDGRRLLWVIDYKSSSTRDVDSVYAENGMQTAAIAKAEVVLLDNGDEMPPPTPIEKTGILNLRDNDYAFVEMPMAGTIDDAYKAFLGCLAGARHIHACYNVPPKIMKPTAKVA